MTLFLTPEEFRRDFASFEFTAFRLETRDQYTEESEREPLRRFLAGEPPDDAWFMAWYRTVQQIAAQGRRMTRVRVVSEPHTNYVRFEMDLARRLNAPAGEDIRYLPRDRAASLGLPDEDFWLLDSERVLVLHFIGDPVVRIELVTDPAAVIRHCRWRDTAWRHAIRLDDYQAHF